jgi:hypothetical protein
MAGMNATPDNISPVFRAAVESLGGPKGVDIYCDVDGTLIRDGKLNMPLYLGLIWARTAGAELHVISGGEPDRIAPRLTAAGADIKLLGKIEDKMQALSGGFAQPTVFVDDDKSVRRAMTNRLRAEQVAYAVLGPESL